METLNCIPRGTHMDVEEHLEPRSDVVEDSFGGPGERDAPHQEDQEYQVGGRSCHPNRLWG